MSNTTHFEEFNAVVDHLNSVGGKSMLWSKKLIKIKTGSTTISSDDKKEDEEQFLAVIFIIRSDFNRFGDLMKDLLHDKIQGTDKYPTTTVKAYELIQGYKTHGLTSNKSNRNRGGGENENLGSKNANNNTPRVIFAKSGEDDTIVPGADGTTLKNLSIRCFKCQRKGHLSNNCHPHGNQEFREDVSCLTLGEKYPVKKAMHMIPLSWVLLDTCTSRSVSNNKKMVSNIINYKQNDWLKLHTNGGPAILKQMAKLNLLPINVHFNEKSMAVIIYFLDVCDIAGIRVLFDSNLGINFDVILPTGETFRFNRINSKLFYFDTAVDSSFVTKLPAPTKDNDKSKHSLIGYSSLQTMN